MSTVENASGDARVRTRARRQLSSDGYWWWNGRRWVAAITEDGLWRWDGSRWSATVSLEGKRPEDLATTLSMLAEQCYAEAGAVLADRAEEWQPEPDMERLAGETRDVAERLRRLDDNLQGYGDAANRGGLLGRRAAPLDDRRHIEDEKDSLTRQHRQLAVRLGRAAPQPSIKDADDRLVAARLLEERAATLTAALAQVDEAERMRADAAVAAQKQLQGAENARLQALDRARKAVQRAEAAHAQAVADARQRMRAVLTPGAGELKGGVGPLRLHATSLETPGGRLPAAGATAYLDSAPALWKGQRNTLHDLLLLESSEAEAFRGALADRSGDRFLLIAGRTGTVLWPCPSGSEEAARRFVTLLREHGKEAEAATSERDRDAAKAESDLDRVIADRSSIKDAEAELARVEADPDLLGAIGEAKHQLERARADTPELNDARRKVLELARRVAAPPEPMRTEG